MEDLEKLKSADLTRNPVVLTAEKTWFLKRSSDGEILPCGMTEAYNLMYNPQQKIINKQRTLVTFQIVGTSDGTTYVNTVRAEKMSTLDLKKKIEDKKVEFGKYSETLEKLIFSDLLEEADKKVIRARSLIAKVQNELIDLEKEYNDKMSSVSRKAFDAELAVAMKNGPEFPPDLSGKDHVRSATRI